MFRFFSSLSSLEFTLLQVIAYSLAWFYNEYVATLLTIIIPAIIVAVLIISAISDLIEPSRVGFKYYKYMILSVLIPLIVAAFFLWAYQGVLDYMQE